MSFFFCFWCNLLFQFDLETNHGIRIYLCLCHRKLRCSKICTWKSSCQRDILFSIIQFKFWRVSKMWLLFLLKGFFYGPIFPISLSHTYNPNTQHFVGYELQTHSPRFGTRHTSFILVGRVHDFGCFFGMDGWMDGWIDSLIHILTSVDILRREREPLFKKRSRVQSQPHGVQSQPHVVDTWHETLFFPL
jgi:hypothetical protein